MENDNFSSITLHEKIAHFISGYNNDEFIKKLNSLIFIKAYAARIILLFVLIAITCFISTFFLFQFSFSAKVIYALIGSGLWFILGITSGVIFFLFRIKNNLIDILNTSVQFAIDIRNFYHQNGENINNDMMRESLRMFLSTHVIEKLTKNIPGTISFLELKINNLMSSILIKVINQLNFEKLLNGQKLSNQIDNEGQVVLELKKTTGKSFIKVFNIVQVPFKISFIIVAILISIILFIIKP